MAERPKSISMRDSVLALLLILTGYAVVRLLFPLAPTLTYTVVSSGVMALMWGGMYYLFTKGTLGQARMTYVVLWGAALAFPFFVLFTQIYRVLTGSLLEGPLNMVIVAVGFVVGGFIGDRAGRRLNYRVWGRSYREEADQTPE